MKCERERERNEKEKGKEDRESISVYMTSYCVVLYMKVNVGAFFPFALF